MVANVDSVTLGPNPLLLIGPKTKACQLNCNVPVHLNSVLNYIVVVLCIFSSFIEGRKKQFFAYILVLGVCILFGIFHSWMEILNKDPEP
jgi:hypothetical protein